MPDSVASSSLTSRRVYRLISHEGSPQIRTSEDATPALGPHDVLVRIEAASLNYRDLLILRGQLGAVRDGLIPLSDGAGHVAAVGEKVTRWKAGDRVATIFYPDWIDGPYREAFGPTALGGGNADGALATQIAVPETALVRIPETLSVEEAATLPCAAVTAWHALVVRGQLAAGDTVLVQGTGGVALFALQIANAFGARTIILSSSDEKAKRARELGAAATVNYRTTPEWDVEVRKLTDGLGASHILELGGPDTFDRSLRSLRAAGRIAQIGVFTGKGPQSNLFRLQLINATIDGINVGSREHFEALNAFITAHGLKPVIDSTYGPDDVPAAYDRLASGRHFGKIVIKL
ncbi:NADPH:quinone reductase [Enhydrobacter aerosaccus]|uniref:NADPH:quinone reductase n=1 Tax=Enhydrobacter aerosaccus TaxID=225324 RepID=A0A1T4T5T8_9HYPH|nr:NAD(P)-dependent alcohol dehydrogenase [Enhydrobacter aerosaccus]SKA35855.1 NADPH:quinone reductase [Enhydrobacter aerosaccus]